MKSFLNHILLVVAILTSSVYVHGQNESHPFCSKRDHFKSSNLKSNTLSVSQIQETDRYDVHYYHLNIAMNNLSTAVEGTVEIHATATQLLDSALFELFESFTISELRVNGIPVVYSRNLSAIKVPVNSNPGDSFIISVDYSGTPPTAATNPLGGSGMTNASSPSWGNQVTWSLSQPFSAYEWWPCKQSLTDKADSCSVWITVPSTCKAGSNGILENVTDFGDGTSRYEWKHRHAIDYYLISVAVAEYIEYNVWANPVGATAPILIQNYIYNNPATLPNFQTEIDETVDFMELFSDLFGPYPFADEKYGHCMAPISGGMEHQTMTSQGFFEKNLTAHELGHQWFGDHVTCASWADIWVNEGFASYSEHLMLENLYPTQSFQHMFDVHDNVMSQTGGSVWVLDSLNENRLFSGRLTYDKGSAIIHTIRYIVNNDDQFFTALRNFQNEFADSVAIGLDVKQAIESESGIDLTNFFNEWYFGEGFPTYSTKWNCIGETLHLQINQSVSKPTVTPLFTTPLEIKFSRQGLPDTTLQFPISSNTENFVIPGVGIISGVTAVDPDNWIINENGTNLYDGNFLAELNSIEKSEFVSVLPNPATNIVYITIPSNHKGIAWLSDQNGKRLKSARIEDSGILTVQDLSQGTYIVFIEDLTNGRIYKKTIIVQ